MGRLAMLPSFSSVLFLSNPGLSLSKVQSCPFDECKDSNLNCLPIFSTNYTMIRKDCDGNCLDLTEPCHGRCEYGQCLNEVEGKCHSCPYKCQHPHFCEASNRCWETLYLYEHKDKENPGTSPVEEPAFLTLTCVMGPVGWTGSVSRGKLAWICGIRVRDCGITVRENVLN